MKACQTCVPYLRTVKSVVLDGINFLVVLKSIQTHLLIHGRSHILVCRVGFLNCKIFLVFRVKLDSIWVHARVRSDENIASVLDEHCVESVRGEFSLLLPV